MNYNVNMWQKINAEQINSQQILVILMVKRQQPFSQQLIICHRHWHYSISTSINFCFIFFEIRKCWVVQHNNTKAHFLVYLDNFLYNLYFVTFLNRYPGSVIPLWKKAARLLKSENNWYWIELHLKTRHFWVTKIALNCVTEVTCVTNQSLPMTSI